MRVKIADRCKEKIFYLKKTEYILMTVAFLAYLVFNGVLLARHDLWRDEANVWLMAKELSPLGLLKEIKYQGHPCLWYLFVMPFAKAGLPFRTISVISYTIMAVTAGLFFYKAPFYKIIKVAVLFSPVFTYYYAVIARNYCLIALLLILLAIYYPKRNDNCVLFGLLLGLLVQADVIALAEAGAISCFWLGENIWQCCKRKTADPLWNILKGIWIPLGSFILLVIQFYHVSDSPVFEVKKFGKLELLREVKNYSYQILERLTGREQTFCFIFFLLFMALMLLISLKLRDIQAMAVMMAAYLFQAVFSVMIYQLHIWHYLSLCFVFIWALWIMYEQREKMETDKERESLRITGLALCGLQGLLLVLSVCMFIRWNAKEETSSLENALYGSYSDGSGTAEYIRENIPPDELIVSVNVAQASAVLAYLPEYDFYYAGNGQKESYADWSEDQSKNISFDELMVWVKKNFPDKQEFYLLESGSSCLEDPEGKLGGGQILYVTKQETAMAEEYFVYQIDIKDF